MHDREAFARACAIAGVYGNAAADVVARRLAASLRRGDDQEANIWRSVKETLAQIDTIACCQFAINDVAGAAPFEWREGAERVQSHPSDP